MLDRFARLFSSLKLKVCLLMLGLVLIFFGTMAQDPLGLHLAQERFVRSFFVDWLPMKAAINKALEMFHISLAPTTAKAVIRGARIPVFPRGYFIGSLL